MCLPGETTIIELNRRMDINNAMKTTTVLTDAEIILQNQVLVALVCHIGQTCDQGHWICFLKDGQRWWKLNDSQIPVLSSPWESQNDNISVNILFYK